MNQQPAFSLFAVPEAPNIQRIGGSAGSHGAVGRPASVRGHRAAGWMIQNRPQQITGGLFYYYMISRD